MSSAGTGRRVGRVLLAIVSVAVLVLTVVGAGVTVLMGQLQSNNTTIDINKNNNTTPNSAPQNNID